MWRGAYRGDISAPLLQISEALGYFNKRPHLSMRHVASMWPAIGAEMQRHLLQHTASKPCRNHLAPTLRPMVFAAMVGDAAEHALMASTKVHNMTRDCGSAYHDRPPLTCTHAISTRMPASGTLVGRKGAGTSHLRDSELLHLGPIARAPTLIHAQGSYGTCTRQVLDYRPPHTRAPPYGPHA